MNLRVSSTGAVPVKAAWRNYECYHLDTAFTAPSSPEIQTEFTERIREALQVDSITPCFAQLTDSAWLCTFFHQAERDHRTSTYENGQPGSITYRPREAATFVFDPKHRILYLAVAEKGKSQRVLGTLCGLLLPPASESGIPADYRFELRKTAGFCECFAHPVPNSMPWYFLKLKSTTCCKPGQLSGTQEFRSDDLLEEPGFFQEHHYDRFRALTFTVYVPGRKRPHALLLEDQTPHIRANLCADTLESVATILTFFESDPLPVNGAQHDTRNLV